MPSEKIEIWLIEDNDVFRSTVARLINLAAGLHCPRAFSSCEETLAALKKGSAPQIIISDVGLPGMNGIEGIKKIKDLSPTTHVLMLTVYEDHQKVFDAICAGASGYLLKNSLEKTLTTAIHDVLQGGAPMNPRVARLVLDKFTRLSHAPQKDYGLSEREKEVLELMSQGMIMKQIADQLSVSYHTINNHLRNIYGKLHVHTRSGAVAKALRENLLSKESPPNS
ncbi:MAG: response regulator receiver [Verrucomicrobiales bacterium]|nr:response regulator receiver [Verrucomicrobiales bacterium]